MSKWRWKHELSNGDSVTMRALTGFDYIPEGQIPILEFYDEQTEIVDPVSGKTMTGEELIEGIKRAVLVLTRSVVQYHEIQEDGETVIDKRVVNKDPLEIDPEKEISVYEIPDILQLEIMAAQARRESGSGVPDTRKFPGKRQPDSGDRRDGKGIPQDSDGDPPAAPGGTEPEPVGVPEGDLVE